MILEKIKSSILNGLGYTVHLKKKNGSKKYCEQYFLCFIISQAIKLRSKITKTLL